MTGESFEKLDQEFMDKLKAEREKTVSSGILKGFSASVSATIDEKEKKSSETAIREVRHRWILPVMAPAFAVILLASAVAVKNPFFHAPSSMSYMDMMLVGTADLAEEISALEELGLWGDEDREILGVSDLEAAPE